MQEKEKNDLELYTVLKSVLFFFLYFTVIDNAPSLSHSIA